MIRTLLALLTSFFALAHPVLAQSAPSLPTPPAVAAKSWLLLEYSSGQVLGSQLPDERVEPASLTKLMTAYLAFSALKQRTLALDQALTVSETAWKATGSRMFIEPRTPVTVGDLLSGMIIQSGNDASVALAEAIAGSESAFAELMNREAQRLGMANTSFRNATGLPDVAHYTTARDLGRLASALIRDFPEEYRRYYAQKEFRYNKINQPNRNRLLWSDPSVDGMKTGFTEAAGYCLIASSQRGPRRLISVVLGTASDNARAAESQKLLNWGHLAFDALKIYGAQQAVSELRVWRGAEQKIPAGFTEDFILAVPKGTGNQLKAELVSLQPLMAPVTAGQPVGTVKITVAGAPWGEYPVVALKASPVAGLITRTLDSIRLWFQ